jgi:HprK-related kinase A
VSTILDLGLYRVGIEQCPAFILPSLQSMYDNSLGLHPDKPLDFHLTVKNTALLRRIIKPQVCIYIDKQRPFHPVKKSLLLPSLEWGLNWCIASFDFNHLLIHSSVIVKNGKAIICPAQPGSGKSTLATYFGLRGWRVYSDEMAIISLDKQLVRPMHRPSSLKNKSIDVIKNLVPEAVLSPTAHGTHKGDIAHVKLMSRAQYDELEDAKIVAVVFPKYQANQQLDITSVSQTAGFSRLVHHAFNYNVLGTEGFNTLKKVVDDCQLYSIRYSDYQGVGDFLDELVNA